MVSGIRPPGFESLMYSLLNCVTLSKLLNVSVLKFHICKMQNGKTVPTL